MSVLLAGSVVAGGEQITLDTAHVDANENMTSLYENHGGKKKRGRYTQKSDKGDSISFYIEVAQLMGAEKLNKNATYRLDSLAWIAHPKGYWTGYGRKVVISNGDAEVVRSLFERKNENVIIRLPKKKNPFYLSADDILEVTIKCNGASDISMEYFDAEPEPAEIRGTAMNLLPDGTLAGGNRHDNIYCNKWRYTSPAVRLCVTEVSSGMSIWLVGGGICGIILLLGGVVLVHKKKRGAGKTPEISQRHS